MRDITAIPAKSEITVAYIRSGVADRFRLRWQRRICEDYARSLGEHLNAVYVDSGVSGRAERRPGLDQLRHDLTHGRIRRIVIPVPHVLAQDTALWQRLQQTIRDNGASLATPCDHQAIASQELCL